MNAAAPNSTDFFALGGVLDGLPPYGAPGPRREQRDLALSIAKAYPHSSAGAYQWAHPPTAAERAFAVAQRTWDRATALQLPPIEPAAMLRDLAGCPWAAAWVVATSLSTGVVAQQRWPLWTLAHLSFCLHAAAAMYGALLAASPHGRPATIYTPCGILLLGMAAGFAAGRLPLSFELSLVSLACLGVAASRSGDLPDAADAWRDGLADGAGV